MHREFNPTLDVMIGKIEIDNNASIYELVNTLYDRLLKLEAENTDLKNKYRLAVEGDKKGESNGNRSQGSGRSKRSSS